MHPIINKIENEQMTKTFPDFGPGDTVKVHTRVIEGDKERVQIFSGVVIARSGGGLNQAFTVRRISFNEGVERVFQLYSPRIAEIEVIRKGKVRRAKLYYLRKRTGKAALFVKEAPRQPAGKKQNVEIVTTSEE